MTRSLHLIIVAITLFALVGFSSCHASKRTSRGGCGCRMEMPLRS